MTGQAARRRERAQAALELAVSVPVLIALLALIVGLGRIVHAELAVQAVAREAARTCASAMNMGECLNVGLSRARQVAAGHNLDTRIAEIELDAGAFERGGQIVARVRYPVALLSGLPTVGLGPVVETRSTHVEVVERYRSREPEADR